MDTGSAGAAAAAANSELYNAVVRGKRAEVLELLRSGVSVHVPVYPYQGRTVLHAAAYWGRSEMVHLLIKHGAGVEARSNDGSSPLHLAASQGHVAAATVLLDAQAPVNSRDSSGRTPLHVAVKSGQADMVRLLLDAGADMEAADQEGCTPLLLASSISQHQPASLLLAGGADVAAKCAAGNTPLHYACERRSLAVMRLLLRAGAAVNAVNQRGVTPLYAACTTGMDADTRVVDTLIASGAQLTISNNNGYIPLHAAAEHDFPKKASCLLRANPAPEHVNAVGDAGTTPLHLAVRKGHGRMVRLLLAAGADVAARDVLGCTPLHDAVEGHHTSIASQLLAAGADPGAAGDGDITPLHLAVLQRCTCSLQVLLEAVAAGQGRAALDAVAQGLTALGMAIEHDSISCVQLLLAAGADPSKPYGAAAVTASGRSLAGITLLHRALELQQTELVPLLANPVNMSQVWQGSTPLHLALSAGRHPSMAQALVAAGSPAGVADKDGVTAMVLAGGSGCTAIRALLPDMVRGECERHQQLQQGRECQQQAPAAVLAAVVEAVSYTLKVSASGISCSTPDTAMACLQGVMEVLGGAVGSRLVQQVLGDCMAADAAAAAEAAADPALAAAVAEAAATGAPIVFEAANPAELAHIALAAMGGGSALQLTQALSKGCSAALEPLMQQRWHLTNRLQHLVTAPYKQPPAAPQQQLGRIQRGAGAAAEAAQQQAVKNNQLAAQAMAAAQAGDWHQFVQLWDQLTGQQPGLAQYLVSSVEQRLEKGTLVGVGGLCEALMQAWVAAHQQVAVRKERERAQAVVGAVQAAQQQRVVTGRGQWRRLLVQITD